MLDTWRPHTEPLFADWPHGSATVHWAPGWRVPLTEEGLSMPLLLGSKSTTVRTSDRKQHETKNSKQKSLRAVHGKAHCTQ